MYCSSVANLSANKQFNYAKEKLMAEITISETNQRRNEARILDVREDFEVAEGMIPGALHIPMDLLQDRLSELDPAVPVIAVCRSGNRSARAADVLNGAGFTADTMAGGMIAWTETGLPTDGHLQEPGTIS